MPFTCSPVAYQVAGIPATKLYIADLVTGTHVEVGTLNGDLINAIGYNTLDNYIYGYDITVNQIVRIDEDATTTLLGTVTNLPIGGYLTGTMDLQGHLFLYNANALRYYVVDLAPGSANYMKLVDPTLGFVLDTAPYGTAISTPINIYDWAFDATTNLIYTVEHSGSSSYILNPYTGSVSTLTNVNIPIGDYGAMATDGAGFLYALYNSTGRIYRITISGGTATGELFSQGAISSNNDGTACPLMEILVDFGDAPDTSSSSGPDDYSTLLANNGPRHQVFLNHHLYLGTQVTAENDAYQNATATGDDISQGIQDDGVILPLKTLLTTDTSYSITEYVTNNTGSDAYLYAWVDFNEDGIFELNEASAGMPIVVPSIPSGIQQVALNFTVPVGVTLNPDHTFVRVRLTSDLLINTNTDPTELDTRSIGPASDGEVEDYYLAVAEPAVRGALFI